VTEVARLVRAAGPKVCVFPINGTRRWFMLEHDLPEGEGWAAAYRAAAAKRHIELYRLFFDHGIDTLVTPIFGPDLLERGEEYAALARGGLSWLARDPGFLDFYEAYGVRVRFYGDYRTFFDSTPEAHLPALFDQATARTRSHDRHRLFFGVCAHEATETIARLAVEHHAEHGVVPDRRALIERYYGEYVEPVAFYLGFDRFCVFDMPLLATGNEDLYFTVCPSPYLSARQLREILYDHVYLRVGGEVDYGQADASDWAGMGRYYGANMGRTLGIGTRQGGVWVPAPQVTLPEEP
jgi:tuberculosinol/isotuberculosinol synthase